MLHEKAEQSRKNAEEDTQEEQAKGDSPKKSIRFSTGGESAKTTDPMKSVLKKGPKVAIKTYKHELVVTIRARVTYERKKNQVRKKFNAGLSDALKLIRDTLLEGKTDVAF